MITTVFFVPNLNSIQTSQHLPLTIYYQNVRGLRSKTNSVLRQSHSLPFDVYALTETNLTPSINNQELFPSSFNVYRDDDRPSVGSPCRGVLIAIKNTLESSIFSIPSTSEVDFVSVKIKLHKTFVYLMCFYILPSQPLQTYEIAVHAIDYVIKQCDPLDEVIICGDFNLPHLKWTVSDHGSHYICNPSSAKECLFIDHLTDSSLCQMSGVLNNMDRQLDLIFSTDPDNSLVTLCPQILTAIDNYHPPLLLTFYHNSYVENLPTSHPVCYDFHKAQFSKINDYINRVSFNFENMSVEEATNIFYNELHYSISLFVPSYRCRVSPSSPPWYNRRLRSLRNQRNKLWEIFLRSQCPTDYSKYIGAYIQFNELYSFLYQQYLHKTQSNLINDPKSFYQFVNYKRKSDGYPTSLSFNNETSNDNLTIANYFASFFKDSFAKDSFKPDWTYFEYLSNFSLGPFLPDRIAPSAIENKLSQLNDEFTPGPDGLPAIFLKKCSSSLSNPLSKIFHLSLSQGTFPKIWKTSFITPIHKKGPKGDVKNYRPIAKLSHIPKTFESILYELLSFRCRSLITPAQHGFLKSRSTTTNLVEFVSFTLKALENGNEVDMVSTDFSKAFDKISHSLIVFKLSSLGFEPLFLQWITSYLENREYCVRFRSALSNPILATSGVPQGSHLGPLLFILTINDIDMVIKHCQISLYADDTKFFKIIEASEDISLLQTDLNSFSTWCTNNCLELNISKCQTMTFSRKRIKTTPRLYYLHNQPIQIVEKIRDLGLLCDRELKFLFHMDEIIRKANSALGFVKRWSKEFSNPYVTRSLYIAFVRPLLEYASQVWSPYQDIHISRIEGIQRRFLRFALQCLPWDNPLILPAYRDRLQLLNLTSLQERREIADILFIHRLLSGSIDCSSLYDSIFFNTNTRNLRNRRLFYLLSHHTSYGLNEPLTRMLRLVNLNPNSFDFNTNTYNLKFLLSHPPS